MSPFDTHCHFEPGMDIPALVARARDAGLAGILAMGGSPEDDDGAAQAAAAAPGFVHAAYGFFPDRAALYPTAAARADAIRALRERVLAGGAVAIGEIGLDFSHDETPEERTLQRELFAAQLRLAGELALPCSIHSRGADADTVAILRECASPELVRSTRTGSLHCFVGPAAFAEALLPLGLRFGLTGILTFRSADELRGTVPTLPRDRLLVETDAPYLAPVPLRGKTCEPAFVVHTTARLADVLGIPPDKAAALTTANARALFLPGGAS